MGRIRRHQGRRLPRGVKVDDRKYGVAFRGQYTDHNGRRVSKAFEFLEDAECFVQQGRARTQRVKAGLEPPPEQVARNALTLAELVEELRLCPPSTWGKRHQANVLARLRDHVLPTLGERPLRTITRGDVLRLRDRVAQQGLAPATVNKVLSALSVVLSRAHADEIISRNPAIGKDVRLRVQLERPRVLSGAEAAAFIDATDAAYRPLFAAALYTGARLGELTAAIWSDIDLHSRRWIVRRSNERTGTKGRKDREVTLPAALVPYLEAMIRDLYRETAPPHDHLVFRRANRHRRRKSKGRPHPQWCPHACPRTARIVAVSGPISEAAGKAELAFVPTFHHLRHSHVSLALNSGVAPQVVRDQVGHSSIVVTDRYSHAHNRAAFEGFDPLERTPPPEEEDPCPTSP